MRFNFRAIAAFLGVTTALATAANASVGAEAVNKLQDLIGDLDKTISKWNGNSFGTLVIVVKTQKILQEIDRTAELFKDIGERTLREETELIMAATGALTSFEHVTVTVLKFKDQFFALPMGSAVVFGIFKALESAADKMCQQLISGAPFSLMVEEKAIQVQLQELFKKVIASFG